MTISKSNLDYALSYAKLGWRVFPVWGGKDGKCKCRRICQSPSKHPISQLVPRGQDDATIDAAVIKRWWASMPDAGIGIFLKPSGLMAIDLDPRNGGLETMEQIEAKHGALSSDVMAFTQGGGEHRIFSVPDGISLPGKLGPGIDIKLNGYIVVEPTHGISGVYAWEASSDPLDGAIPSPLPDWMRDLTVQTQPVVNSSMSRHVTASQLEELTTALPYIPSDERDTWLKIGMALHSIGQSGFTLWDNWSKSSSKYNPVDQMRVWSSFKGGSLNYESVFFIASEHGFINCFHTPMPDAVPLDTVNVVVAQPKPTAPSDLLNPPGILGKITSWINATSRKSQPQFDVQAAIAFCSVVMGRRYCTDQNNWPSLYLLNIGKSSSGKEHAKWAVESMLEACKLEMLIGPAGYTSNSGVLSTLSSQPVHISIMDEFGKVLESASVKGNTMARSSMVALMEAWGRCDGVMRPQGYSTFGMSAQDVKKIESRTVHNPALTTMGMATPDSFFESIGTAAARDGFLNRFLIVESDIGRQAGTLSKLKSRVVPKEIVDWGVETSKFEGLIDPAGTASLKAIPKVIPINDDAHALFMAYEVEAIASMDAHDEIGLAEMFGRCCEQAMRLSLIVAVADGWKAVNADHAEWAINYVRYYTGRTVAKIHFAVSDSDFQALSKQVFNIIQESDGVTERDLNRKSRKFAKEDYKGKENVLRTLVYNGDIVKAEFVGESGKKIMKWFAVDHSSVDEVAK